MHDPEIYIEFIHLVTNYLLEIYWNVERMTTVMAQRHRSKMSDV